MNFLTALTWAQCAPFAVALALMAVIAAIEIIGLFVGWSVSAALSELFDADAPEADLTGDNPGGVLSRTLGWLRIGRLPLLIALLVALAVYGLAGLVTQMICHSVFGVPLPGPIAAPAVAIAILPMLRVLNGALARAMPHDETEAVSRASFAGRSAIVTLGPVSAERPGQARLRDRYGQAHHVMIVPDVDTDEFAPGEHVLLVHQSGARWRVIAEPDST